MEPKFSFYEIVKVVLSRHDMEKISGVEGIVLGRAEDSEGWGYAVYVPSLETTYDLVETELLSTGRYSREEDVYSGTSVHVVVTPDTNEGHIA